MRYVIWMDKNGWKHRSLLRDNDPDSMASGGIPADPPDVKALDWESIMRDLHNAAVERGLFTQRDLEASGDGIHGLILSALRKRMITLYRENNKDGHSTD